MSDNGKWRNRIVGHADVAPGELTPHPENWRTHPQAQAAAVAAAIDGVGLVQGVVVNKRTGRVLDGHLRLDLALARKEHSIPVTYVDLDDDEERLVLVTLDPLGAMAEADAEKLTGLLEQVKVDEPALQAMLENLAREAEPTGLTEVTEDEVPEPPDEAITQPGDLWVLGDHRLLCGDCTKAKDVQRVMGGEKAILMNTDPPYGIAYDPQMPYDASNAVNGTACQSPFDKIQNDDLTGERLQAFLEACIRTARPHLADATAFYLWHPMLTQGTFFAAAAAAADILIHRQIIWVKPHFIFGRGDYHWKHELCFYGWMKGHRPEFYGERNQDTVWIVGAPRGKDHPTQKPVELFAIPMNNHTRGGDICYEPFCGSGSQLIAAEQLGRRCYAIEIEPRYVDVAVERWQNLTGRKAERESAE